MYLPPHFRAPGDELATFLRVPRFADLVTHGTGGLVASSLPLLFEPAAGPAGSFVGHLARANPQWSDLASDEALVLLRGPDAYVSPAYYPTRRLSGEVVPTWNYLSVQAHGRILVHDDPLWTERLVRRLTAAHEDHRLEPWSVDEVPRAYLAAQLRAIVGIEIAIEHLEGKWKLSQNRSSPDREGVIENLSSGSPSERAVAAAMRRRAR
jgi:transcriptional regulator